jgi:hypothetical protein
LPVQYFFVILHSLFAHSDREPAKWLSLTESIERGLISSMLSPRKEVKDY